MFSYKGFENDDGGTVSDDDDDDDDDVLMRRIVSDASNIKIDTKVSLCADDVLTRVDG